LIEWDTDVPRLEVLLAEAARADVEAGAVAVGVAGSATTPRPDRPDRPA
jgi:hypothetical protein